MPREVTKIIYPEGKRLALSFHFPVEWWETWPENPQKRRSMEYGALVGAWRLLDVFDRTGIKATTHINGMIGDVHPDLAREIVARGHDLCGHSYSQTNPQFKMTPDQERAAVARTIAALEGATGARPAGWVCSGRRMNPDTPRILAEAGMEWHSHHDMADLPILVDLGDGLKIMDCPVSRYMHYSDRAFIGGSEAQIRSCSEIFAFYKSQIDALRGAAQYEPLYFQIGAHAFLTGLPAYAFVFQEMIAYAQSCDDVWILKTGEMARYCRAQLES
jgi:hypothetical protein